MNTLEERLNSIEQLIQNSAYQQAYLLIIELLHDLQEGNTLADWVSQSNQKDILTQFKRIAHALYLLFQSPTLVLDKKAYLRGLLHRESIHQCFCLVKSPYLAELLDQIIQRNVTSGDQQIAFKNPSDLYKFLLLASVSHAASIKILFEMINTNPNGVYYVLLSCLCDDWELEDQTHRVKQQIIEQLPKIKEVSPSIQSLYLIQKCMAKSAYMPANQAATIKSSCHQLIQNYIEEKQLLKYAQWKYYPLQALRSKPRILLLCECFWPGHVVHRCFVELIAPLKEFYELIAITAKSDHRNKPWDFCDEVIEISDDIYSIHLVIDQIRNLNADLAIYTSIGMRNWAVLLSRLRLAAIQMMLPGHPDAQDPLPDSIDYLLTGELTQDSFQSKNLVLKTPGSLYVPSTISPSYRSVDETTGMLKIAVCANVFKMTFPLLTFLTSIEKESEREICFEVFLNTGGINYLVTSTQIKNELNHVTVHPAYHKTNYLEKLAACHLLIGTFPFGGENTVLDALSQQVPVMVYLGEEMRSKLDQRVLNSLSDIPEFAVSRSVEELKANILILLTDATKRLHYGNVLKSLDLREIFQKEQQTYHLALKEVVHSLLA